MKQQSSVLSVPLKVAPALTQLIAIGSVAIGVATILPIAPAQAASLTGGELDFSGKTSGFFSSLRPTTTTLANTFSIDFNQNISGVAQPGTIDSTTGPFTTLFPSTTGTFNPASSTGSFEYVSGSTTTPFYYKLTNDLVFSFTNGVNLTIGSGTTFLGSIIGSTPSSQNASFQVANYVGSFFSNGAAPVDLESLAFNFNDTIGKTGGYTVQAVSVTVPEPFTVIGSIVGGTAALRMRKKLKATTKA